MEQRHRHQQQLEEDGLASVEERRVPPATAPTTVPGNMRLRNRLCAWNEGSERNHQLCYFHLYVSSCCSLSGW